jgi:biofilm protein TabA
VILGDFRKWSEDKWLYAERLAQHMDYLSTRTFDEIEDGVLPERHQRYMDIHYILAGSETIGFARECEKNQSLEVTPVIDDHIFFQAVEHEMALTLYPGQYAIFLPDDIHRPWCTGTETNYVRKALLKVPVPEK